MNDGDNFTNKYYAPFYHKIIMHMYILEQNIIQQIEEFVTIFIFGSIIK